MPSGQSCSRCACCHPYETMRTCSALPVSLTCLLQHNVPRHHLSDGQLHPTIELYQAVQRCPEGLLHPAVQPCQVVHSCFSISVDLNAVAGDDVDVDVNAQPQLCCAPQVAQAAGPCIARGGSEAPHGQCCSCLNVPLATSSMTNMQMCLCETHQDLSCCAGAAGGC